MKKQAENEQMNENINENTTEEIKETTEKDTSSENTQTKAGQNPAEGAKEEKNKALEELNDKYIRLYAEYDNYRKRTEKEKGEMFQAGLVSAVSLLLPVLDNLERALSFEPENEGLKLLCKLIIDSFDKMGVKEIESDGKEFDPELHNAVMHEEDSEKGENIIVQTFQKGYTLNGKVIRHAVVKVVN